MAIQPNDPGLFSGLVCLEGLEINLIPGIKPVISAHDLVTLGLTTMFIRNYNVLKVQYRPFCALTVTIRPHTVRLAKPLPKKGGGLEDLATRVQLTR